MSTSMFKQGCTQDELERILKLFLSHSHGPELHVRHIAALDTICKGGSGFQVQDLPIITEILGCTLDLVLSQHSHAFLEPACSLVRAVGRPYIKQSSTDELRIVSTVTALLQQVARVFTEQLPCQLQACTAQVLEDFASVWGNRPAVPAVSSQPITEMDIQSVQRAYHTHQTLLYESQVVPAICLALQHALSSSRHAGPQQPGSALQPAQQLKLQVMADAAADAGNLAAVLTSALLEFSYCPQLCEQMLQAGVLQLLSQQLLREAAAGMNSKLSIQVIELLWNLFDLAADTANQVAACSSTHNTAQPDCSHDHAELGDQQQEQPETACDVPQQESLQQCQQQQRQCDSQQPCQHSISPVAQELVGVLAVALQHQVATCSSLQRQQQRNDTLTVICLLSQCSTFLPAIAACGSLIEQLLAVACRPTAASDAAAAANKAPGLTLGGATPSSSNSGSLEADHNMQLLAWSILGNAAAEADAVLAAVIEPGLLQLLLDAVAYGVTAVGLERSSAGWFARLAPEQMSATKQLAWSVLQQVAPLCKASFIECGGISVLLESLTAATSSSAAAGNSAWLSTAAVLTNSTGLRSPSRTAATATGSPVAGKGSSCSNAEPALHLMRRLLQADAGMAAAVVEDGAVPVLLQVLQAPCAAALTPVRQGVLLCLSEVCSAGGRAGMTAVRQADGVALLLKECQSILDGDPYVPSLAALDALWRCCIHSNRSRAQLLAADGIDVILGLLQRGNPALRPVLLSLLADLLKDKRSHNFFWEWHAPAAAGGSDWSSNNSSFSIPRARPPSGNGAAAAGALQAARSESAGGGGALPLQAAKARLSSTGSDQAGAWLLACCGRGAASILGSSAVVTAAQLLVLIWRHQDEALGVSGPEGIIANPSRPLSGTGDGRKTAVARASSAGGGPSNHVDAYGLMLPGRQVVLERIAQAGSPHSLMEKVYACFAALGVAGSKDSSSVSPDGLVALQQLPAADLATLAVIQQYPVFRQGEVWQDIQAGFCAEGLQLTQEDSMRLESGIQHAEMVAAEVQAAQAALLGAASAQQLAIEKTVYDNMAAQAAADARAKVYEKDSSKLTMRERLAAKARKEDMLKRSCAATAEGLTNND